MSRGMWTSADFSRDADELVEELNEAMADEARTAHDLGRDEGF